MDISKDELKRLVKSKIATLKRLSNHNRKKQIKEKRKIQFEINKKNKPQI